MSSQHFFDYDEMSEDQILNVGIKFKCRHQNLILESNFHLGIKFSFGNQILMCESNETNPKWQVIFAQLHDPLNIPLLHGYLCTS